MNGGASRPRPIRLLIVTDGSDDSSHAASVAGELFPGAEIEIMTAVPLDRSLYTGTTGFAGPVISEDELGEMERSRTVDAMGATASTARALGPRPARLTTERGEPIDAVVDVVHRSEPDVVVIASTGRGSTAATGAVVSDLVSTVRRPVVVVPPQV